MSAYTIPSPHLTLGVYNLFSFTTNTEEKNKLLKIISNLKKGDQEVGWELWRIEKGRVVNVDHWEPKLSGIEERFLQRGRKRPDTLPIKDSSREYTTQMATAYLRACHYWSDLARDLDEFDDYFTSKMQAAKAKTLPGVTPDVSAYHEQYVTANAALSQQTEQAYTGVSPILETRGHYSMHSLLGIGIASRALQNLTSIVRKAFADAAFLTRVEKLSRSDTYGNKPLYSLDNMDAFFDEVDPLSDEFLKIPEGGLPPDETSPCLAFFSARDGFRSTPMTISAPFEVTTSANTRPWTLQTLTHEITHILIGGVLVYWLPQKHDKDALRKGLALLDDKAVYDSLGDQLTECLCLTANQLDDVPLEEMDEDDLAACIERHYREMDETLTHCFDFLYFYQKDVDHYVHSVWASWDVIPNIAERVPDYVIRTACALLTLNLRKKDAYKVTLDQLVGKLKSIPAEFKNSEYIEKALRLIDGNRAKFEDALQKRENLVKIVRYFLYSPEVLKSIFRDDVSGGKDEGAGSHGGYPMKWLEFGRQPPQNPLRFLAEYAKELKSDPARTSWLLQYLAFCQ